MTYQTHHEDKFPTTLWPGPRNSTCSECRSGISDYIQRALAGLPVAEELIPLHLTNCPDCSWLYIEVLDLMTATQTQQLMDSWIDPQIALPASILSALLSLYQLQLGAAERVHQRKASAHSLSFIGIIYRQLNDLAEARLVHELTLRTTEVGDNPFSAMLSHADLGYIALSEQCTAEALWYFQSALQSAKQLTDDETEARIHILLGQAWAQQHDWASAQSEFKIASEMAQAANYSTLAEVARKQEQKVTMTLKLVTLLSQIDTAISQPIELLRQALQEIDELRLSFTRQGLPSPLAEFYDRRLQRHYGFAPGGEMVLVVNLATEIPMRFVSGPQVDRAGNVTLAIALDAAALADLLPSEFYLDLLFLPTNEVLHTVRVGADQRIDLQMMDGLELKARLPGFADYLERLHILLNEEGLEYWQLPKTAFPLRIRWEQ